MYYGTLYGQKVPVYGTMDIFPAIAPILKNTRIHRNNRKNPRYISDIMTFDVETTVIKNEDKPDKLTGIYSHFNYVYHWQACVFGLLMTGRYIEEWFDFCNRLSEILPEDSMVLCFVHNLAFEYNNMAEYFCGNTQNLAKDIFMRDNVRPLKIVNNRVEYRCSLQLTHKPLSKLSTEIGLEKSGDLDYKIPRHSKTPLTDSELEYCLRDVYNLYKWVVCEIDRYCESIGKASHVCHLPLTQTGYVRYDIKKAWSNTDKGYYYLREMKMTESQYYRCKKAFRGGDTHANYRWVCKTVENVRHRDFTSAYPAVMVLCKFPCRAWRDVGTISQEWLFRYMLHGHHIIATYDIANVSLKQSATPYIAKSKCDFVSKDRCIENGRVMNADRVILTITEIDFKVLCNTYDFDIISIDDAMICKSDYLPEAVVKVILKYFRAKTVYKGVEEKRNEYDLSKQKLNGIYGCSATALDHDRIVIDPETFISHIEEGEVGNANVMPYQWAPYVTAYVRYLLNYFKCSLGDDFIYCDTDSIFYRENPDFEKKVDKYNSKVVESLKKRAKMLKLPDDTVMPKNPNGETQYLGTFANDDEYVIDRFLTAGAKRYITQIDGLDCMTFSGVTGTKPYKNGGELREGKTITYIKKHYGKDIFKVFENFANTDIFIPYDESFGKLSNYVERGEFYGHIDDGATVERVESKSSMVLVPVDQTLTLDKSLFELLFKGSVLII